MASRTAASGGRRSSCSTASTPRSTPRASTTKSASALRGSAPRRRTSSRHCPSDHPSRTRSGSGLMSMPDRAFRPGDRGLHPRPPARVERAVDVFHHLGRDLVRDGREVVGVHPGQDRNERVARRGLGQGGAHGVGQLGEGGARARRVGLVPDEEASLGGQGFQDVGEVGRVQRGDAPAELGQVLAPLQALDQLAVAAPPGGGRSAPGRPAGPAGLPPGEGSRGGPPPSARCACDHSRPAITPRM